MDLETYASLDYNGHPLSVYLPMEDLEWYMRNGKSNRFVRALLKGGEPQPLHDPNATETTDWELEWEAQDGKIQEIKEALITEELIRRLNSLV